MGQPTTNRSARPSIKELIGCCLVWLVIGAVTLAIIGSIGYSVWAFIQPDRNNNPLSSSELAKACEWPRDYFPQTTAYTGPGPHPVEIIPLGNNAPLDHTNDSVPDYWNPNQKARVQLVACLDRTDVSKKKIKTCHFDVPEPKYIPMYQATYRITVYAAKTGDKVGQPTITVTDDYCPSLVWHLQNQDPTITATPSEDDFKKALAKFTG